MVIRAMAFEKANSAGYLANHMARLFAQRLSARIRPVGLAPAQFLVLLELWQGDGLSQKDLVQRLDVEQATMANTLARMERDGLIARRPHADDRRTSITLLTAKGRSLEAPAKSAAMAVNRAALKDLTAEERATFLSLARRVIDGLKTGFDD